MKKYLISYQPTKTLDQIQFLPFHNHGQGQRVVKGRQGQNRRPAQGLNGIQDHQKAAWPDGDSHWCDYLEMEQI